MMTRETFGDLPIFIMKNGARLFRQVGAGGAWDVDPPGAVDVDSAEEGGELGGVLHSLDGGHSAAVQLGVARRQEPAEWAWERGVMCSPGGAGCEWYCLVCLLLFRLGVSRHSSMRYSFNEEHSMRLQIDDSSMRSCQRGHRQECFTETPSKHKRALQRNTHTNSKRQSQQTLTPKNYNCDTDGYPSLPLNTLTTSNTPTHPPPRRLPDCPHNNSSSARRTP